MTSIRLLRALPLALLIALLCAASASAGGTLTVDKRSGTSPVPMAGTVIGTHAGGIEDQTVIAIDCGSRCSAHIPDDEFCKPTGDCFPNSMTVGLAVTPATGWSFTGWSGGCSGTSTGCKVDMPVGSPGGSRAVTANFHDVQAPTVALQAPADNTEVRDSVAVEATASDNWSAKLDWLLDDHPVQRQDGRIDVSGKRHGEHVKVAVRATDPAGNTTTVARNYVIDTVAPDAHITGGPPESAILATPEATYTFAASDTSPLHYDCRLDGEPYAPCGSPGSYSRANVPDGPHRFHLRVTDRAGNATELSRGFTVNAVRPAIAITSGPADGSTVAETAVTFGFAATGAVEVSCSLDSATSFRPCSGAGFDALSRLGDGAHVFRVMARDETGETAIATRNFGVDTSQPQTRIDAGPAEGSSIAARDVTFAFSASVEGAGFRCRFGAPGRLGPFGPCSGPGNTHRAGGLAPGTYVFEVQALNALGTPDASPERRTFTLIRPPAPFRVANFWTLYSNGRTGVKKLTVKKLPAGARVEVRCKGPRCPFKRDTAKVAKGSAPLKKLFGKRKLGAGAVVEIRITAPGIDGRAVRFRMRAGKFPKRVELCLPQATGKPTRC